MRGATHLAGGISAAILIGRSAGINLDLAAGIAVAGVASLAPDWINVALPFLSVRGATGHRGFTYWLLTALVTSASVGMAAPTLAPYWLVGYISHLLLDTLTTRGAPVLWPLPWQVSFLPINEGGLFDNVFGAALVVIAGVVMVSRYLKS